jgi:Putative  PD-(D/E)XK family member, (DUF4420)
MLMIDDLWKALDVGTSFPAHRRISQDHPLDLFAQIDAAGRVGLLAISGPEPGTVPAYSAVEVAVGRRGDGQWATSLSLKQGVLRRMFSAMCDEIVSEGRNASPGSDASTFMLQLLARWHRLLALGPDGLLSQKEQLGLLGEVTFLSTAIGHFGAEIAVAGWNGPHDSPQDFSLPCGFVEVKAVRTGSPEVGISSLEQLDIDVNALSLVVYELSPCAPATGGNSLASAVAAVRTSIGDSVQASAAFEGLLYQAGYVDRREYSEQEFRTFRARRFSITDDFPRLRRSALPLAVSEARYRLLLAGLDRFESDPLI